MDTFSLEDDDYGDLFITQSSNVSAGDSYDANKSMEEEDNLFLGIEPNDFVSPVKSILGADHTSTMYSDISDCDETEDRHAFGDEKLR